MKKTCTLAAALLALACAGAARADAIPYPTPGTENPITYTFTASSDGDLSAWFAGSSASYDETLGVLVNGADSGVTGLQNHHSAYGQTLDFGAVHAGDVLTFYIDVQTTGATYYSDRSLNADGNVNHVYSTAFSGDASIPAGTYVAFEDLDHGGDFNYQDEQFVFSNTTTTPVPEPAGIALMLAGLGVLGSVARRRR